MLRWLERRLYDRLSPGASTNYGYRPGVVFDTLRRTSILRSLYYSRRLRGRVIVDRYAHVRIGPGASVTLRPGATLVIGIEPFGRPAILELLPRAEMYLDGSATLMGGSYVQVRHEGRLRIGARTYLNADSRVTCAERIELGSDCAISWNVTITDTDVHELRRPSSSTGSVCRPVEVCDHVWIGAGSTVLKGVVIGPGSVVGAGSVVTREVPAATLVAGNPARTIESGIDWCL